MVSVIIVTLNRLELTKMTIESVRQNTHLPFEIIVVDNLSLDGTKEWLKAEESKGMLRCILNETREGKLRAVNQGLDIAKFDTVVVLDNDVLVEEYCIDELVRCGHMSGAGMVGPRANACSGGASRGMEGTDNPENWRSYDRFEGGKELWVLECTYLWGGCWCMMPKLVKSGFRFPDKARNFALNDALGCNWVKYNGFFLAICLWAFAYHAGPKYCSQGTSMTVSKEFQQEEEKESRYWMEPEHAKELYPPVDIEWEWRVCKKPDKVEITKETVRDTGWCTGHMGPVLGHIFMCVKVKVERVKDGGKIWCTQPDCYNLLNPIQQEKKKQGVDV